MEIAQLFETEEQSTKRLGSGWSHIAVRPALELGALARPSSVSRDGTLHKLP